MAAILSRPQYVNDEFITDILYCNSPKKPDENDGHAGLLSPRKPSLSSDTPY